MYNILKSQTQRSWIAKDEIFYIFFRCECLPGYAGDNCEININDCGLHYCHNEGECIDGIGTFSCQCLPGFTGR